MKRVILGAIALASVTGMVIDRVVETKRKKKSKQESIERQELFSKLIDAERKIRRLKTLVELDLVNRDFFHNVIMKKESKLYNELFDNLVQAEHQIDLTLKEKFEYDKDKVDQIIELANRISSMTIIEQEKYSQKICEELGYDSSK